MESAAACLKRKMGSVVSIVTYNPGRVAINCHLHKPLQQIHEKQQKIWMAQSFKSPCPVKSKSGKPKKIDFLCTKHIEGYWYDTWFYPILIRFNGLS